RLAVDPQGACCHHRARIMSIDADEPIQDPEAPPPRRAAKRVEDDEPEAPAIQPYPCASCGTILETEQLDKSPRVSRPAAHGCLAAFAGVLPVVGAGSLASRRHVMDKGWFGGETHDTPLSMAFVLLVCSAVMFAVELAIRLDVDGGRLIKLS